MQSGSPLFYLIPPEKSPTLQTIWKMSAPPSYKEFVAEISKFKSELSTLQLYVQAKKAHEFVPDFVKMPAPELFTGKHDGKMLMTFLNVYDTF